MIRSSERLRTYVVLCLPRQLARAYAGASQVPSVESPVGAKVRETVIGLVGFRPNRRSLLQFAGLATISSVVTVTETSYDVEHILDPHCAF